VPICVADAEAFLDRGTKENASLDRRLPGCPGLVTRKVGKYSTNWRLGGLHPTHTEKSIHPKKSPRWKIFRRKRTVRFLFGGGNHQKIHRGSQSKLLSINRGAFPLHNN
jgi:hypothetical protein